MSASSDANAAGLPQTVVPARRDGLKVCSLAKLGFVLALIFILIPRPGRLDVALYGE